MFSSSYCPLSPVTNTSPSYTHSCYMPSPFHLPRLNHYIYTWQRVQITKLLIMQFSPSSRHSITLRSKYSPQHIVLEFPQSKCLPYCQRPSFTPICVVLVYSLLVYPNSCHNQIVSITICCP
jgi:hypothetical protein